MYGEIERISFSEETEEGKTLEIVCTDSVITIYSVMYSEKLYRCKGKKLKEIIFKGYEGNALIKRAGEAGVIVLSFEDGTNYVIIPDGDLFFVGVRRRRYEESLLKGKDWDVFSLSDY